MGFIFPQGKFSQKSHIAKITPTRKFPRLQYSTERVTDMHIWHDMKTEKKFGNTLYTCIRIFITEILVEINMNLIRFLYSKCDYNLIQYQIVHAWLQNFICMERSACHKMFSKGQNVLHVHLRWFQTVSVTGSKLYIN